MKKELWREEEEEVGARCAYACFICKRRGPTRSVIAAAATSPGLKALSNCAQ